MKKMLRFNKTVCIFTLLANGLLIQQTVSAQVPQTFNYQGIARDGGGNVLPARKIGVELSVLDGGPTGTVVYTETFTDTTNAFGLFSMQVGGGTVVSGSFAGINWATGNKYLQTSIDLSGGTSYSLSGTTQLLSVPYALYAQTALSGSGWGLKGNAGTTDSNFVGTTDLHPLYFKIGDSVAGELQITHYNVYLGLESGDKAIMGPLDATAENTGIGGRTLYSDQNGTGNTAIGYDALAKTNGGLSNTGVGVGALSQNLDGFYNTGIGGQALNTNMTGTFNTALGYTADVAVDGLNNATAIGYNAVVTASNMVQIGNTSVTSIQGQVPFTTPSDGRFKFNIQEDVKGLDFILKLRPVTYQFNSKKEEDFIRGVQTAYEPAVFNEAMMVRRSGFIAQEVERAAKMTGYDFDGLKVPKTEREYYSLSYSSFVVPLVKAVQEQEGVIQQQQQRIDDLTKQVEELRKMILALTQK
jgi:trimeric autotransporter adhesin